MSQAEIVAYLHSQMDFPESASIVGGAVFGYFEFAENQSGFSDFSEAPHPSWVSNTASILLIGIGAFLVLLGWWRPDANGSWVIGTCGLFFVFLGLCASISLRLTKLREAVEELQKNNQ